MESDLKLNALKISCIILNYNTAKYTIACVRSIVKLEKSKLDYEIIIIDNASKKEDYEFLKDKIKSLDFDQVKIFRSKKNLGFGGGNMLGVQMAGPCKYYAFINNDTLHIHKNTLSELNTFMDQHPSIGICSPQMLDQHHNFRVTIDHFSSLSREILRRPLLEKLSPKKYLNRKKRYKKPIQVHYVQGSYLFTQANAFHKIGGFDDNLFLYYEESDLSKRLLKNEKLSTYLYPDLEYIHYKSASTQKNIAIKIEQKISVLYYTRKHHGFWQHKILLIYFIIRYFFSSIVKPKNWKLFFVLIQGAPISVSLKQKQPISIL